MDTVANDDSDLENGVNSNKPSENSVDNILMARAILMTNQEGEEDTDVSAARLVVTEHIKEEFKRNGGLPIDPSNMLPIDLNTLKSAELVNVMDNIELHLNRTRKADITSRAFTTLANILKTVSIVSGFPALAAIADQVEADAALRDSVVQSVLGKGVNPPAIVTTGVIIASYISNAVVKAAEIISQNGEREQTVLPRSRYEEGFRVSNSSSSD